VSVVTHTGAGSNLGSRAAFFFGQVTVSEEQMLPSPTWAWQIPTGAHLKICQNYTHVFTNQHYPPLQTNKQLMAIVAELNDQLKKKKNCK